MEWGISVRGVLATGTNKQIHTRIYFLHTCLWATYLGPAFLRGGSGTQTPFILCLCHSLGPGLQPSASGGGEEGAFGEIIIRIRIRIFM